MFKKRNKYSFTHPEAKAPYVVKAFSEDAAWRKMKRFVIEMKYGPLALTYDALAVEEILGEVRCEVVT